MAGKAAPYQSGEPFNRCTHVALSPRQEIYVSDGYGNSRVHKYAPDGKLLLSWGESGSDPGKFNIVHNICTDRDGWVYVADRENNRIQVFDGNDIYNKEGNRLARLGDCKGGEAPGQFIAPHGIAIDSRGDIYVGEVSWTIMGQHLKPPRELRCLQKLKKLR